MSPEGKRLTMICASLVLLHPLLSLTHWIFRSLMLPYKSSSLVQIMFAVHRFAQGMAAASPLRVVDCRWRGNKYKVSVTGLAFVSLWRPRHFERRYKPVWFHSFMEPVKGSPEISLQNAALRQSVQHRVSFLRLPSYTLSHCAGLPLKGKQGLAAELAMCCLSPAKHSAEFAFPLWCLTAPPFSTGKRLTWFSGRYHSPTNQVRLPPRCAG